jgi:hypothetical protein
MDCLDLGRSGYLQEWLVISEVTMAFVDDLDIRNVSLAIQVQSPTKSATFG